MKWTCTLHKKILRDLRNQVFKDLPIPALDALPDHSHELLLALEDLVASLYAPQDSTVVSRAVKSIGDRFQALSRTLFEPPAEAAGAGGLAEKMSQAAITDTGLSEKKAELPHGYDTSFRVLDSYISKALEETPS